MTTTEISRSTHHQQKVLKMRKILRIVKEKIKSIRNNNGNAMFCVTIKTKSTAKTYFIAFDSTTAQVVQL